MSCECACADVAIVGAGPVGLFAIFECGMLGISCHVFDALAVAGGQCAALYPEKPIYDIPGYPRIMAADLIEKLKEQAAPFKPVYRLGEPVTHVSAYDDGLWRVKTAGGENVLAKAVIVAAGVGAFGPNRPPLAGIEEYEGGSPGQGVDYVVSRREDYRDKRVVIAGGGDSAVDWALSLAELTASVAIVHRRDKFRAAPESVRQLRALVEDGAVELVIPYQLRGLEGTGGRLEAVIVSDLNGGERRLPADVLLPFFGLSQDLGPIADWGLHLHRNHVAIDPATCSTGHAGLFAIGDIATYPGKLKLILTGFAEAAIAAHAIYPLVHPGNALHFEYSTSRGLPSGG